MSKLLSGHFTEHQYLQLSNDITLILASYPSNIALLASPRYVEYVLTDGYTTRWVVLYKHYPSHWVYDSNGMRLTSSDINKVSQFIDSTRSLFNLYSCIE